MLLVLWSAGCLSLGQRVAELEEDVKSLSAELTELSLASSPSVGTDAELNALRADIEALQAVVDGQAKQLAELSAELDEVKAGSDTGLATQLYDLAEEVSDLRTSVETLEAGAPQAWSLVQTGLFTSYVEAWESIHDVPLEVDLTGGPLFVSCWADSNSSGEGLMRVQVTDSSGLSHASSATGDEGTFSDGRRFIFASYEGLPAGPAVVTCDGYHTHYVSVRLTVLDLGL